jgi:hypothetical protein
LFLNSCIRTQVKPKVINTFKLNVAVKSMPNQLNLFAKNVIIIVVGTIVKKDFNKFFLFILFIFLNGLSKSKILNSFLTARYN